MGGSARAVTFLAFFLGGMVGSLDGYMRERE